MLGFYENFVRQCNKIGKSPSKVAEEVNISKSIISRWKKGGGAADATAMKIAEYFGISVQELTGEADLGDLLYETARDEELIESPFKEKEKPSAEISEELLDKRIIERLISLTPEELQKVDAFVQGLLASR